MSIFVLINFYQTMTVTVKLALNLSNNFFDVPYQIIWISLLEKRQKFYDSYLKKFINLWTSQTIYILSFLLSSIHLLLFSFLNVYILGFNQVLIFPHHVFNLCFILLPFLYFLLHFLNISFKLKFAVCTFIHFSKITIR